MHYLIPRQSFLMNQSPPISMLFACYKFSSTSVKFINNKHWSRRHSFHYWHPNLHDGNPSNINNGQPFSVKISWIFNGHITSLTDEINEIDYYQITVNNITTMHAF